MGSKVRISTLHCSLNAEDLSFLSLIRFFCCICRPTPSIYPVMGNYIKVNALSPLNND